jgi:hypothetical protein
MLQAGLSLLKKNYADALDVQPQALHFLVYTS